MDVRQDTPAAFAFGFGEREAELAGVGIEVKVLLVFVSQVDDTLGARLNWEGISSGASKDAWYE